MMRDFMEEEPEESAAKRRTLEDDFDQARSLVAFDQRSSATMVRAAPGDVTDALQEYQRIQSSLDHALPDCTLTIRGKLFRKKSYWRAIAVAFNLTVDLQSESVEGSDGDFGYLALYRATAPNGRSAVGDGACFASEKEGSAVTVHNVRSHAHTRALNRAISNLVGFGEVSAEEVDEAPARLDSPRVASSTRPRPTTPQIGPPVLTGSRPDKTISEAQRKRLWAIWSGVYERECPGGSAASKEASLREIVGAHGYEHTSEIRWEHYDPIILEVQKWKIAELPAVDEWK